MNKTMKNIFSRGNHKLPKNIAIFNIPELKTCPGKTEACSDLCYAIKSSRMYHHVVPTQRKRNIRVSISAQFVIEVCKELNKYKKVDTVRIHEAGDFYSQVYLNKWIKIAIKIPKLIFFAYTKSYMLDYSKLPSNFIVFYSSDWTTKHYSVQLKNQAIMMPELKRKLKKNNTKLAMEFNKQKVFQCPGSCKTCNYCYTKPNKTKFVSFPLH